MTENTPLPTPISHTTAIVALVIAVFVVLIIRIFGPSDFYQPDQTRTTAYTQDMVTHGRWALPRDTLGLPARKPPLYNWLTAPVVALGFHQELALKLPSIFASLATIITCVVFTRWLQQRAKSLVPPQNGSEIPSHPALPWIVALLFFATSESVKHIYFARPDMLLTALLTISWATATVLIYADCTRPLVALTFWLSIAGAVLAKGPMAAAGLIYLILGAKLLTGRWSVLRHSGWWWGVPIMLAAIGSWIWAAYISDPVFFTDGLIRGQMIDRIVGTKSDAASSGLTTWFRGLLAALWQMPLMFIERFAPWSILAFAACFLVHPRRWFAGSLGPAYLWVFIIVGLVAVCADRGGSYIMPAGPACALLAGAVLVHGFLRIRWNVQCISIAGLIVAITIAVLSRWYDSANKFRDGDNAREFTHQIADRIGSDSIMVLNINSTPILTLLGRHPGGLTEQEQLATAQWIIAPVEQPASAPSSAPARQPVLVSKPLPYITKETDRKNRQPLGLFPRAQFP